MPKDNDARRPNVIWVFGDQHPAHALSCNANPNVCTPNLDLLANGGVLFENAVSGYPLCCPFRGSLLTGRYPHHCVPGHEFRMPPEMPTIASVFNQSGYDTAYFGKWHVDGFKEAEGRAAFHVVPPARRGGFRTWIGYENNNSQWDCWVHGHCGAETVELQRVPGYETDGLTDLLIDYIRRQTRGGEGEPFFAALSVQPPHNPYAAPAEYMARHNPARIELRPNVPQAVARVIRQARLQLTGAYAQIENLDWNIGRIRQALESAGLDTNTHILYFSDHGDMHGSHGQWQKTSPYAESLNIPFIIGGCQAFYRPWKAGRVPTLLNHVDIAPTTLGLCGIKAPDSMEGSDYASRRFDPGRSATADPDSAFLQNITPSGHGCSLNRPWRGLVTQDGWKYASFENVPWMMFNQNEDPYEQVNLVHDNTYQEVSKRLNARLQQWVHDTGDVFSLS